MIDTGSRESDNLLFGQIALELGLITREQLINSMREQAFELTPEGMVRPLGEILISKGLMTGEQLNQILHEQRQRIKRELLKRNLSPMRCNSCSKLFKVIKYNPQKQYLCKYCKEPLIIDQEPQSLFTYETIYDSESVEMDTPGDVVAAMRKEENLVGKYVILRELGKGGMSKVYLAWDNTLARNVALKIVSLGKDELKRFEREARIAAQLNHPSIVPIYEIGSLEDKHFIAMQYVEGKTIDKLKFDINRSLQIIKDAAGVLDYAHNHGIIHRDIKPQNIMLDTRGRLYIMDFGIAKRLHGVPGIPAERVIIGTPNFMSPEQAEGKVNVVDHRSDIYCLGATLYYMVTGHPPFKGDHKTRILRSVIEEEPVPPRSINPKIPREIEYIIARAMEKDPSKRYQGAQELAGDLDRYSKGEPVSTRPKTLRYKLLKKIKKNALTFLLLFLALAGTITSIYFATKERAQTNLPVTAIDYYNLAKSLAKKGYHLQAVENFSISIKLNPESASSYYERGLSYSKLNMINEAIKDFEKCLELDRSFEREATQKIRQLKEGKNE